MEQTPNQTSDATSNPYFTEEEKKIDDILRFLEPNPNLPAKLQGISRMFASLAIGVLHQTPRCPERTVAFRKILEAKDCAVRAAL